VGVLLYRNWDVIKAKAIELWTSLTETFNGIKESIINKIEAIKAAFSEWVNGAINIGKDFVQNIIDGFLAKWDSLKQTAENIWNSVTSIFKRKQKIGVTISGNGAATKVKGSHYHGLNRVPYDGYIARLHKGEAVLPQQIAEKYRKEGMSEKVNVNMPVTATQVMPQAITDRLKDKTVYTEKVIDIIPRLAERAQKNLNFEYVPRERPTNESHHRERVQTAQEAKESRQGVSGGIRDINLNIQAMNVRKESDIESIANALAIKILQAKEAGA
jgi:hypothetical protein